MYSINFTGKWDLIGLQTSEVLIIFFQVIIIKKNFFFAHSSVVKGQRPNQWTARESPHYHFKPLPYLAVLSSPGQVNSGDDGHMQSFQTQRKCFHLSLRCSLNPKRMLNFIKKSTPPPAQHLIHIYLDVMYHIDRYSFFIHIFWFLF